MKKLNDEWCHFRHKHSLLSPSPFLGSSLPFSFTKLFLCFRLGGFWSDLVVVVVVVCLV